MAADSGRGQQLGIFDAADGYPDQLPADRDLDIFLGIEATVLIEIKRRLIQLGTIKRVQFHQPRVTAATTGIGVGNNGSENNPAIAQRRLIDEPLTLGAGDRRSKIQIPPHFHWR